MSIPHTATNTLTFGPNTTVQTVLTQLPPPVPTIQTIPPIIPGGSGPSIHTVPLVIPRGSGRSAHTIPLSIPRDSGPSTTMPQVPPFMQGHHVPTNPTTIVGPSHINLGSNLPFMACLHFLDLARLTNEPIYHQAFLPPLPTKLPSNIPKFEGKAGECPQNHIMTFHLW